MNSGPFLEVTCATCWGDPRLVASTTLENTGLSEQLHREPGRWQQLPVIRDTREPPILRLGSCVGSSDPPGPSAAVFLYTLRPSKKRKVFSVYKI